MPTCIAQVCALPVLDRQFAHAVFPTTFAELVTVTGGETADVA
jgi:hypothetical protein